jgi:hypothetical protein
VSRTIKPASRASASQRRRHSPADHLSVRYGGPAAPGHRAEVATSLSCSDVVFLTNNAFNWYNRPLATFVRNAPKADHVRDGWFGHDSTTLGVAGHRYAMWNATAEKSGYQSA